MSKAAELANLIGNINAGGGGVNRNIIINGAMNVAQRSTSETGLGGSNGIFVCDRWRIGKDQSDGRFTMSQDSSAPSGFANSLKFDCTTADASVAAGEQLIIGQRIEGQNLQAFAKGTSDAKPFAVSFYVKGNASATYCCELRDKDNDRTAGKLFSVTTDWTRVELTFDADTTGTFDDDNARSLDFNIFLHAGATYNDPSGTLQQTFGAEVTGNRAVGISSFFDSTDRTFFITGVQLEVGQNPTTFEHEPFETTLRKCQRYFEMVKNESGQQAAGIAVGYNQSTTAADMHYFYKEPKRTEPATFTVTGQSNIRIQHTGTSRNISSGSIAISSNSGTDVARMVLSGASGSMGDGDGSCMTFVGDASISFDSEL